MASLFALPFFLGGGAFHANNEGNLYLVWNYTVHVTDVDKLNLVKLCYDGSILGSSQFSLLSQLLQKMVPTSKVVKSVWKISPRRKSKNIMYYFFNQRRKMRNTYFKLDSRQCNCTIGHRYSLFYYPPWITINTYNSFKVASTFTVTTTIATLFGYTKNNVLNIFPSRMLFSPLNIRNAETTSFSP